MLYANSRSAWKIDTSLSIKCRLSTTNKRLVRLSEMIHAPAHYIFYAIENIARSPDTINPPGNESLATKSSAPA